ncbi:MAG: TRAP transporter small permease subunit [Pseudomonadota bacterium]|jgi:TRAP-type C4-dicarboxylate transport system permease small subunit|nr:TRAP transporter small permease subunit [Pseudomonadota bacterium]|tara:strand:+ start:1212 stop:1724 length:513 start_codon:yes stop_codon:yes gene_type:complete
MNNLLLPLQFINGILSKITFFIAMAIVCVMVLALSASALTRYISGHGFDWFIELPPALVSWLVFPMLGPLLKTGNHIEVDFVSTILSAKSIKYVKFSVYLISFISSFIFFKAGLEATLLFYNLGQMMELEIDVPIWIMFLSFPVGFIIMGLFSLELLLTTSIEIYKDRFP